MPALPAVPNVLKVEVFWKIGVDTAALNRWHVAYTGGAPSDANCVTIAQDINAIFVGAWLSLLGATNYLEGVSVQDLTSASAGSGEYLASNAGTRSGGALGAGMAVLTNGHIQRRYRGGKPRSYLPLGAAGDLTDANDWDATVTNSVNTLMGSLQSNIAAITVGSTVLGAMVNVSYYHGFTAFMEPSGRYRNIPTLRTGGPQVDDIVSWAARTRVASQRRRNLMRS